MNENWPEWMQDYLKRKIAESSDGTFKIKVSKAVKGRSIGNRLGMALARKIDVDIKDILDGSSD